MNGHCKFRTRHHRSKRMDRSERTDDKTDYTRDSGTIMRSHSRSMKTRVPVNRALVVVLFISVNDSLFVITWYI